VARWLPHIAGGSAAGLRSERVLRALSRFARLTLGLAGLALGLALIGGTGLLLAGRVDLLEALWPRLALAASLGGGARLAALVAGGLLAAAGPGLAFWKSERSLLRAALALGVGASVFFASVFHPMESTAENVTRFYARTAQLVGDEPLAVYGGKDLAPNWILRRTRVPRLVSLEQAEAYGRTAGGRSVWIVARPKTFEKHGRPAGFREVLGEEQRPGRPLVLLRSDATEP
jgi:hypothetical protein